MSLLTPERVPVKVYKWDDVGAPALDKTAGCMMTIFKACLVTGYGTKEPAGWTMPYEDTAAKVKVMRPEVGPHADFYLRLSADTGIEMAAQIYLNMSDANTGDLKLQCATPFKYAVSKSTGRWLLVASSRGFWFFCEQSTYGDVHKTGGWFFTGDTSASAQGERVVYMHHMGGTASDKNLSTLTGIWTTKVEKDAGKFVSGKSLDANTIVNADPLSYPNGTTVLTTDKTVSQMFVIINNQVYGLPGIFVPFQGPMNNNFDDLLVGNIDNSFAVKVFGTGMVTDSNFYVATDLWSY